jgi:hypothetical protein
MKKAVYLILILAVNFNLLSEGMQEEELSNPGPFLTDDIKNQYNLGMKFSVNENSSSVYSSIDGVVYRFSRNEDNLTNFGKFVEIECSDFYFYNNEEKIVKFHIIYSNLSEVFIEKQGDEIKRGTEIGKSGGSLFNNNLLICIYTFKKDPYICYLTKSVPENLLDVYWYNPGFLYDEECSTFNYFKYREINLENFVESKIEVSENSRKIEIIEENVRFSAVLTEMPGAVSENALIMLESANNLLGEKYGADFLDYYKTSTELIINNTPVYLLWPEGFELYLYDEIGAGNNVYIYGMVTAFNHLENSILLLAGDFTDNRLETLIEAQYNF